MNEFGDSAVRYHWLSYAVLICFQDIEGGILALILLADINI